MELPLRTIFTVLIPFLIPCCTVVAHAQNIVAHRGASHAAPENTLVAFELAWKQRADAIEGDFYVTKDGHIVCIHDKTTKRVAPAQRELKVAESTLDELRTLDVGSWKHQRYTGERIPTLAEVLATVPEGKQIFVEIKCGPEILPLLQRRLEGCGLKPEQIVIICFSKAVITQSRRMMPQYNANWLTGYEHTTEKRAWQPTANQVLDTLKNTGATGLGTQGNLKVINQPYVDAICATGLEFHVWTVNDADPARIFKSLGVHSITTDRPEFIRNVIQTAPPEVR